MLEAYRNAKHDEFYYKMTLIGLVGIVSGAIFDRTALAVGGGALCGLAVVEDCLEYAKAYMEARLDYLANNKFTKLQK